MALVKKEKETNTIQEDTWLRNNLEWPEDIKQIREKLKQEEDNQDSDDWQYNSEDEMEEEQEEEDQRAVSGLRSDYVAQDTNLFKSNLKGKGHGKPGLVANVSSNEGKNNQGKAKLRWQEVIESAAVSEKVENLCLYKCPTCKSVVKSRRLLGEHLRQTKHATTIRGGQGANSLNIHLIKAVMHECKICHKKILCDKHIIKMHIRINHKIYFLDDYSKMTSAHLKKLQDDFEASKNTIRSIKYDYQSESVGNLCRYECKKCNKTFNSRKKLSSHLQKTNHAVKYEKNHDSYIVKAVVHKCKICSREVWCESDIIADHLRLVHKIRSIADYIKMSGVKKTHSNQNTSDQLNLFCERNYSKYEISKLVKNLCFFECHKCDLSTFSWAKLRDHMAAEHKSPTKIPVDYATKIKLHKCHICHKLMLCDKVFITGHLRMHKMDESTYIRQSNVSQPKKLNDEYLLELKSKIQDIPSTEARLQVNLSPNSVDEKIVTNNVGNLTFFKCSLCTKENMSFSCLLKHRRASHQSKNCKYDKHEVQEARYHKCLICARIILCDNQILRAHVSQKHRVSFQKYKQEYVLKNGGKVFPSLNEYFINECVLNIVQGSNSNLDLGQDEDDNGLIQPSMLSSESEESDME